MEFEILDSKKVVDGKMDLLSTILLIDYEKISIDNWILVDEFTEMGLDYIAEATLGSPDYVWLLVKFNRISHPLEVQKGDIIAIPNLDEFRSNSKLVEYTSYNNKISKTQSKQFNEMKSSIVSRTLPKSNFVKQNGNVIF